MTGEVDVPKARKLVTLATKTLVNKGGKLVCLPQPPTLHGSGEIPHDPRDYHPRDEGVWPFSYHSVNEHWQTGACIAMGLRFVCPNGVSASGPTVSLRHHNLNTLKNTTGDGNCMYRALSYLKQIPK